MTGLPRVQLSSFQPPDVVTALDDYVATFPRHMQRGLKQKTIEVALRRFLAAEMPARETGEAAE